MAEAKTVLIYNSGVSVPPEPLLGSGRDRRFHASCPAFVPGQTGTGQSED